MESERWTGKNNVVFGCDVRAAQWCADWTALSPVLEDCKEKNLPLARLALLLIAPITRGTLVSYSLMGTYARCGRSSGVEVQPPLAPKKTAVLNASNVVQCHELRTTTIMLKHGLVLELLLCGWELRPNSNSLPWLIPTQTTNTH
jgi:hypothetical protein